MVSTRIVTVEAISEMIAHEKGRGISVLIGAGLSMSSGIPSAAGMIKEISKRFPKTTEGISDSNYAAKMGALSTVDRKRIISELVGNAKLNPAHYFLGLLMAKGYIKRIISTNFDPLAAKACYLHNCFPAVYDLTQVTKYERGQFSDPSIIYLHGQSSGFRLVNTSEELRENKKRVSALFDDILDDSHLLVVGYSGQNDDILSSIAARKNRNHRIIWCTYGNDSTSKGLGKGVLPLVNSSPDNKIAVNVDADRFFSLLAFDLKIFPGLFLDNPISYVRESYFRSLNLSSFRRLRGTGIKTFAALEHMSGYESRYRQQVPDLREQYREMSDRERGLWRRIIAGPKEADIDLIHTDEPENEGEKKIFSWIAQNYATHLGDRICQDPDLFSETRLDKINDLFEYAAKISPSAHQSLHNWGSCLALVSKSLLWREDIFLLAHDKILESNNLRDDKYVSLNDLGYFTGMFAAASKDMSWKGKSLAYLHLALKENASHLDAYLSLAEVHSKFREISDSKKALTDAASKDIGLSRHHISNNEDLQELSESEPDWFASFIKSL